MSTPITFWKRFFLFIFAKRVEQWDRENEIVNVWRVYKDTLYLIHTEPYRFGDQRNHQINEIFWIR